MSLSLGNAGGQVTLLTFDGLLGQREQDRQIDCQSVVKHAGIFGPLLRFVSRLLHRTVLIPAPDSFVTVLYAAWWQRRHKCQVIHLLDDALPMLSPFFLGNLVKSCAIVITLHNPYREQHLLDGWDGKFRKALWRRDFSMAYRLLLARVQDGRLMHAYRGFLYRRANRRNQLSFICLSEDEQKSYAETPFGGQTVVIPEAKPEMPAADRQQARRAVGIAEDDVVFLSFGVNHDWKNYQVIFQAAQGLEGRFKLLFAGRVQPVDAARNDPVRLAAEHGCQGNTIVADKYISADEIPLYFAASDALILSYRKEFAGRSGGLRYASQFGLPVIASDGGAQGEAVKGQYLGLTFTPDDPVSMRQALAAFLALGRDDRDLMKQNVLGFAYTIDQMAASYLKLYGAMVNGGTGK